MRVIYDYPVDAQDGDDFVIDEITVAPSTLTIVLKRHVALVDIRDEDNREALRVADRLIQELAWEAGPRPQVVNLLRQSYCVLRPVSGE